MNNFRQWLTTILEAGGDAELFCVRGNVKRAETWNWFFFFATETLERVPSKISHNILGIHLPHIQQNRFSPCWKWFFDYQLPPSVVSGSSRWYAWLTTLASSRHRSSVFFVIAGALEVSGWSVTSWWRTQLINTVGLKVWVESVWDVKKRRGELMEHIWNSVTMQWYLLWRINHWEGHWKVTKSDEIYNQNYTNQHNYILNWSNLIRLLFCRAGLFGSETQFEKHRTMGFLIIN